MTRPSHALILVPALGSLVAAALRPGTGAAGMTLRSGLLILVLALLGLAAVALRPGTGETGMPPGIPVAPRPPTPERPA
ncbi:hypothetical protein [Streptomyces bauhiniae]|uniref:hypothetical protein n=1 Tax=Streptomyces bauhiniae TaxID=2340725 RepID=UPI003808833B